MSTARSSSSSSQPDTSIPPSAPSVPGVDPSVPYLNENPGVCRGAWYERQRNGPGGPGGMPEHALAHPCSECGMKVAYKLPIRDWERHTLSKDIPIYYPPIAPRYQFESHMDTVSFNPFGPQLYGCWICFERHGQRCGPMTLTQWYEHHCGYHLRRGEIGCLDWYGRMQARKECRIPNCPRLHT